MTTNSAPRRIAKATTVGLVLAAGAGVGALAVSSYQANPERPAADQVTEPDASTLTPASPTPDPERLSGPLGLLRSQGSHDGHDSDDDHHSDGDHATAPQNDSYLSPAPQQAQPPSNPGNAPHSKSSQS